MTCKKYSSTDHRLKATAAARPVKVLAFVCVILSRGCVNIFVHAGAAISVYISMHMT